MNYIIFDLEWNQCPDGKNKEVAALPFEIIEIGAVKLNNERIMTDKFHRIIRPAVYPRLHFRTREIIHKTEEELRQGMDFPNAVREFLEWAGSEMRFCTWGAMDLIELQRNMKYYKILSMLKGPMHFYDVQKLFAIDFEQTQARRSLEYAIDFLKLEKAQDFHQALSDAYYTAEVFCIIDQDVVFAYDSIDAYQNPKTKKEEIYAIYNGYSKYISREFESKEKALGDKEVVSTQCCSCEKLGRKKLRWFSVNSKNYYCIAFCPVHGYLKGKIRMKKTEEGRFYVIKTVKASCETEERELRKKKEGLVLKRKQRRRT